MRISDWSSDVCSSDLESLEHFEGAHDFQIARKVVVSGEKEDRVASCLGGCVDRDIGVEHDLEANVLVIEQVADHHHDINVVRQLGLEIGKLVALALAAAVERDAVREFAAEMGVTYQGNRLPVIQREFQGTLRSWRRREPSTTARSRRERCGPDRLG